MPFARRLLSPVPVALAYFLAASLSVAFDGRSGSIPFLWAATAIVIADLTRWPRRMWVWRLPLFLVASFGATIIFGRGWGAALPTGVADLLEATIAAQLLGAQRSGDYPIGTLAWLGRFVIPVGIVAPVVVGCVMALISLVSGFPPITLIPGIVGGHAFGNICFTPLAMLLLRRGRIASRAKRVHAKTVRESVILFGLVAGVSAMVFGQNALPLLFLPLFPVVLVSFRLGHGASGIAVVIVGAIGTILTLSGRGPVLLVHGTQGEQLLFLQFYLAATILSVLPIGADLELRKKLHRELRNSEERYRLLAEHSTDIIMHIGTDHQIRYISPAITRITGVDPAKLIGQVGADLVIPDDRAHVAASHFKVLEAAGEIVTFEYRTAGVNGEDRWLEARARLVIGADGEVEGVVSMLRDISIRKESEARLSQAAYSDSLTGIANRRGFELMIDQRLAARAAGSVDCIALFDIDHFKQVNDQHGHDVGDAVLHMLGRVMQSSVRPCDTIARMGGEEFAVHLPDCTLDEAVAVCEQIRANISQQTVMAGKAGIRVTTSGGVALFDHDYLPRALKQADQALYVAKRGGRDQLALAA